jgi:exosortase/archaeosortase family protein
MMFAVIPAAIFANFVRVMILILITYYYGDSAAQGFLHGAAGLATFVMAILFIFGVDSFLTPIRRRLSNRDD